MKLLSALVSRKWWWVSLLVLLGMVLLGRLGIWQLDRLQQRRAANVQLAAALSAEPVAITADSAITDLTTLKNRLIFAQGEYDLDYQGVLKLQNFQGQPGVHLVVPLVLADGETAVLVDRGWVPDVLKDELFSLTEPGPVTVNGYVALPQTLSRAANIAPPETLEWFRLDIEQIQSQIPYQLLPIYIVEWTEDAGRNTADLPVPIEREIDLSEGSHLSYAIQWFIFSLILGIGYVIFVRRSLNV